jgi:RNA 3'-terminal phosphate cyclase
MHDTEAVQPGAALAAFADVRGHDAGVQPGATEIRLGADAAGARGRTSEAIGRSVAAQLLDDLKSGATLDRWGADQIIPFAALADGESHFRIPWLTDHVTSNSWLVEKFLGARIAVREPDLVVTGIGFCPK